MTSIMRKRLLVIAAVVVMVALLVVTMQAVFAEDNTFVTTGGAIDGDWPWKSAFGTTAVGNPPDSYHAAVNHWNPASNGSISMAVKDGVGETMSFEMTNWDEAASVVSGSGSSWTWDTDNPSHAPAAYPDVFSGCHWGQCTFDESDYGRVNAGAPYPIQAGKIENLIATFDINVSGDAALDGSVWDAAFDIWLDTGSRDIEAGWMHKNWDTGHTGELFEPFANYVGFPVLPGFPGAYLMYQDPDGDDSTPNPYAQNGQNDGAEVMIWMNNRGYGRDDGNPETPDGNPITPAGHQIAWSVSIPDTTDGSLWDVWGARLGKSGENSNYSDWNVISYVRVNNDGSNPNVQEMRNFDANVFIQDAMTRDCPEVVDGDIVTNNKCASLDWWLTSVQTGFEIWAQGKGLSLDEFSVKPNTNVQVDTGRTTEDGKPLIHWDQKFLLRYKDTCGATSVGYTIHDNKDDTADITGSLVEVVPGVESGTDLWAARVGPINPNHEDATITITPSCGSPTVIPVYVDPSGVVVNTLGEPIEGADVTLNYAPDVASTDPEPAADAFEAVPNGSDIMSPANRENPDKTDAVGYYRWDVADGWYKVKAEKDGCTSAESPALPVSEGNPATNVNLVLDCGEGTGDDDLLVQVTPQNDWGTGYCSNVTVTNNTSEPADWKVTFDVEGAIYDFWNATWSQSGTQVTAEANTDWQNILQPGESTRDIGFCANRAVDPTPDPDDVTVVVTTQSDWGTGYCANIVVTNNSATEQDWKVTFPVVGTVNNLWNATWAQSGNQVTAEGVSWNNILQPGQSTNSIGYCAAK